MNTEFIERTRVTFRCDRCGPFKGRPFAILWDMPVNRGCVAVYTFSGGHTEAPPSMVTSTPTRLCTEEESARLKRELETAPYNYGLKVVKRAPRGWRDEAWS